MEFDEIMNNSGIRKTIREKLCKICKEKFPESDEICNECKEAIKAFEKSCICSLCGHFSLNLERYLCDANEEINKELKEESMIPSTFSATFGEENEETKCGFVMEYKICEKCKARLINYFEEEK